MPIHRAFVPKPFVYYVLVLRSLVTICPIENGDRLSSANLLPQIDHPPLWQKSNKHAHTHCRLHGTGVPDSKRRVADGAARRGENIRR